MPGATEGTTLGITEGTTVGITLGNVLGSTLGAVDTLTDTDGDALGVTEGAGSFLREQAVEVKASTTKEIRAISFFIFSPPKIRQTRISERRVP